MIQDGNGGQAVIEAGFFSIHLITAIAQEKSLVNAKAMASKAVDAQPNARASNITKARSVIASARTVNQLAISLTNFMLAHPSENLSVNKGA